VIFLAAEYAEYAKKNADFMTTYLKSALNLRILRTQRLIFNRFNNPYLRQNIFIINQWFFIFRDDFIDILK
jgi:hypothetical protein